MLLLLCLFKVSYILDVMGEQSSKAQGLKQQITSGIASQSFKVHDIKQKIT